MLFVSKMLQNLAKVQVVNNGNTCCVLYNLALIVQSQQQRPECLNTNLAKTQSTFCSDLWILVFAYAFNEKKLAVSSKIFNAEYS